MKLSVLKLRYSLLAKKNYSGFRVEDLANLYAYLSVGDDAEVSIQGFVNKNLGKLVIEGSDCVMEDEESSITVSSSTLIDFYCLHGTDYKFAQKGLHNSRYLGECWSTDDSYTPIIVVGLLMNWVSLYDLQLDSRKIKILRDFFIPKNNYMFCSDDFNTDCIHGRYCSFNISIIRLLLNTPIKGVSIYEFIHEYCKTKAMLLKKNKGIESTNRLHSYLRVRGLIESKVIGCYSSFNLSESVIEKYPCEVLLTYPIVCDNIKGKDLIDIDRLYDKVPTIFLKRMYSDFLKSFEYEGQSYNIEIEEVV